MKDTLCYNVLGDIMGKYSLVVEDTLKKLKKIIDVVDLDDKKIKAKVNIKDIDCVTSSFESKDKFLEYLCDKGIIDFHFGNTYIVSIHKGIEQKYDTIYNNDSILYLTTKVKKGFICDKSSNNYQSNLNDFIAVIDSCKYQAEIEKSRYINRSYKDKIIRYMTLKSKSLESEEEMNELNFLLDDIKQEASRYKTYRGIVLFLKTYNLSLDRMYVGTKKDVKKKEAVKTIITNRERLLEQYEQARNLINGMTDTEAYNQKYDEYLSEEEYEWAYHGIKK